jgi:hypothetical protein
VDLDEIAPGGTSPFTINLFGGEGAPATVEAVASGHAVN